jgi:YidC/Oxa1 family membrane protein insertase
MFTYIWHTLFFDPIYNSLVFFIDVVRGGDVGLAIIFTVVLVKVILLPVSLKAARTQRTMQEMEPKMTAIKEKHKDNREEQARQTLALFQTHKVNPFTSIMLMFLQIPIVIALYFAVYRGGGVPLPDINTALLYSFIPTPETVSMLFFGLMDITQKSIVLALLAGITQYIYTHLSMPKLKPRDTNAEQSFKDDFNRSLQLQMRYVMPIIIVVAAYTISAAIALYFTVSNLMSIAQEYVVRHKGLKSIPK